MKPQLKLISEEIVRWAFEVKINHLEHWEIAFTNPTAGPWKRVQGADVNGKFGEVHRFEIDEKRPDLILYSDHYKTVIIIEAKTDLPGLADSSQIAKTSELFCRLSSLLKNKNKNPYWGDRAGYDYVLGLLWGKDNETPTVIDEVVTKYLSSFKDHGGDLICVQGSLVNESLIHRTFWGRSKRVIDFENYQR